MLNKRRQPLSLLSLCAHWTHSARFTHQSGGNMLRTTWTLLVLLLTPTALSTLHPECEYIFQLERDEQHCLQFIAEHTNKSNEGCLPMWDAVVCWPPAVIGDTVYRACPAVFSLFKNNTGTVARNCTSGGWSRPFPPYHVACSVDDDIPETEQSYFATVKLIYTVGYSVSLTVLAVAVLILMLFRKLHCARNFIHIQLFITFILKAVSVFIKDATLFSSDDTNHCTLSTFACKASVIFCHYCVMANFFWLLVEALYLNSLLLSSLYHSRCCMWGFSVLGWGVPFVFISLWIGSRLYFEDTECWDINEESQFWWIIKGPIVVSIAVNFMLFMNIIRILFQKLNPRLIQFNNSSQYRRLIKSTLLLIPLFGTHYMFFNFLPDYFNVNIRFCIELCLGSFQGLLVAILYCFLNQEPISGVFNLFCLMSYFYETKLAESYLCFEGSEGDPHAVAEVAGEELWSGVACGKVQPNGHTFLGPFEPESCQ